MILLRKTRGGPESPGDDLPEEDLPGLGVQGTHLKEAGIKARDT